MICTIKKTWLLDYSFPFFFQTTNSSLYFPHLPQRGQAVGLLPESAPPWGHLGGNGHLVEPSTTSMRQRGKRWREWDHRWLPAGTTGSPIHLEMEKRDTQWTVNTALPLKMLAERILAPWGRQTVFAQNGKWEGKKYYICSPQAQFWIKKKIQMHCNIAVLI